jgi:hypothetical protein
MSRKALLWLPAARHFKKYDNFKNSVYPSQLSLDYTNPRLETE